MAGKATKGISLFLVSLACALCFALPAASAQNGSDDSAVLQGAQPDAVRQAELGLQASAEDPDGLQYETLELHLIQRGENPSAAAGGARGMSLGAQAVSDEQLEAFKARLNNGFVNVDSSIRVDDLKISLQDVDLLDIISDVVNSNPDLFYVNSSVRYSYYNDGTFFAISPSYSFEKDRVLELKSEYEAALQQVLSWVPDSATNVQKAKAVHDWLVRNCSYNTDAANAGEPENYVNGWRPWTAYGAVVDKSPVCQGYSLAFIAAVGRLGIQATYVADETHGWNRALIDGSWFNLDITHDDPLPDRGFNSTPLTTYFMKSDAWFKANPSAGHHTYWSPAGVPGTDTRYDGYTSSSWTGQGLVYSAPAPHAAVTSFALSETFLALTPDSFGKINIVNVQPSEAPVYAAVWTSSDPSVAMVDSTGKVCAGASRGTATVTCTINGISRSCAVQVHPSGIMADEVTVTFTPSSFEYDGSAHKPQVSVQFFNAGQLVHDFQEGVDYSLSWPADTTNAGEKVVVVEGLEGFAGSVEATYTVERANISTATMSIEDQSYTGAALTPAPTVQLGNANLQAGVDYTLSYTGNVNAGTARVVVTGQGNYTGTASGTFTINPVPMSNVTLSSIPAQTYCGHAIQTDISLSYGGALLVEDKDYWVLCSEVVDAGAYTLVLNGMGNFTGSKYSQFTIAPKSIADSAVSIDAIPAQLFTGEALVPAPVISDAETGQTLVEGEDYTLSYYDNTQAGQASIAISGKGNYDQTRWAFFVITSDEQDDIPEAQSGVPVISARDMSVCVGADLDLLAMAAARDSKDGDITSKLEVSPRAISTASAGTYSVTYSVSNSAGAQATKTVVVTVSEHDWDEGVVTMAPTCEADGANTYTCKTCGSARIEALQALGHSFTNYVSNGNATCTEDGTMTASCDHGCGATDTLVSPNTALGHAFTTYTSDHNATCVADGTKTASCDHGCGVSNTVADTGSALGHSFTTYSSDHNATCVADGTKTASCDHGCGATNTVADKGSATGHSFTKYISDRNATCEADGTKTASCDHGCGATNTVADKGSAQGHSWDEGIITTQPTTLSRGVRTHTCKTCGAERYVSLPKLSATSLTQATILGLSTASYTGKAIAPRFTVAVNGKTLTEGEDYSVSFTNNVKAGNATVVVTGLGDYTDSKQASFTIAKASNKAKVAKRSVKKSLKVKTLKKKALTVALPKVTTTFGKAKWKVVTKDKKGVLSLKNGKVKVKKGAKKARYVLKLKAYVTETANYKKATSKTVTVKITVK